MWRLGGGYCSTCAKPFRLLGGENLESSSAYLQTSSPAYITDPEGFARRTELETKDILASLPQHAGPDVPDLFQISDNDLHYNASSRFSGSCSASSGRIGRAFNSNVGTYLSVSLLMPQVLPRHCWDCGAALFNVKYSTLSSASRLSLVLP